MKNFKKKKKDLMKKLNNNTKILMKQLKFGVKNMILNQIYKVIIKKKKICNKMKI